MFPSFCMCPLGNFLQPRNEPAGRAKNQAACQADVANGSDAFKLSPLPRLVSTQHLLGWVIFAFSWYCNHMGKSLEPAHEAEGVCPKYSSRQEGGRREHVMSGGCSWALLAGRHSAGQAGGARLIHFCRGSWGYSSTPFPSFHLLYCCFVLLWGFFPLWGIESGKAFAGTLVLLWVSD